MKEIVLKNGGITLVDDADFEYLNQFSWRDHEGYAEAVINGESFRMQKLLMSTPEGLCVHHEDRNRLNNQRFNLTIMTNSEHMKLHWSEYTKEEKEKICCYWNNRRAYLNEDAYYADDLERQEALIEHYY